MYVFQLDLRRLLRSDRESAFKAVRRGGVITESVVSTSRAESGLKDPVVSASSGQDRVTHRRTSLSWRYSRGKSTT